MPTVFSHPAVPLALRLGLGRKLVSDRLLAAGIVCCVLPDIDVLAFHLGVSYWSDFGHRGFTHSLFFAFLLASVCAFLHRRLHTHARAAFGFAFAGGASHGLLDAFTNGGLGIALLWPLSNERFFFYPRVLEVSPLGLSFFASGRAWDVLRSELTWVWLPCALAGGVACLARRAARQTG